MWVLSDRAEDYKDRVSRKTYTIEEAIDKFRHDAYIVILVLEKLANEKYLNEYKKLYNRLKSEINELPGDVE